MADKTIGELPEALEVQDDSLLVMEQQGEARRVRGERIMKYAREGAQEQAKAAKGHAEAAQKSQEAAAESARDAMSLALHPPILKDGSDHWWTWSTEAGDYVDSGIDAGVSLMVSPETITGEPGSAAKVENIGTRTDPVLRFTLPRGDKGEVTWAELDTALAGKQDKRTFDDVPTEGSQNAVRSGGVWDALQRKPNPNLLDNWYFKKPVNQRRQTTYVGPIYSIDRWRSWSSSMDHVIAVSDAGLKYTAGTAISNFVQIVEIDPDIGNNMMTFSFLANGELYVVSGRPIDSPAAIFSLFSASIDVYLNNISVTINIQPGNSIDFIAAKLELGSEQTLAHKEGDTWVLNEIPDYATELAKCQRYQYVISTPYANIGPGISSTTGQINVVVSTPMFRVKPSVKMSGDFRFIPDHNGRVLLISNPTIGAISGGGTDGKMAVEIKGLDASALTIGTVGWFDISSSTDSMVLFDANL